MNRKIFSTFGEDGVSNWDNVTKVDEAENDRPYYNKRISDPKHAKPKSIVFEIEDYQKIKNVLKSGDNPHLEDASEVVRSFFRKEYDRWLLRNQEHGNSRIEALREIHIEVCKIEEEEAAKTDLLDKFRKLTIVNPVSDIKIINKVKNKFPIELRYEVENIFKDHRESVNKNQRINKANKALLMDGWGSAIEALENIKDNRM